MDGKLNALLLCVVSIVNIVNKHDNVR